MLSFTLFLSQINRWAGYGLKLMFCLFIFVKKIKMYKKESLLILFVLLVFGLNSQQSMNTQGGNFSSSTGSLSYSIGQVVYEFYGSASFTMAEGVQQPFEVSNTFSLPLLGADIQLSVYPNPAINEITLNANKPDGLEYHLFTIHGKLLESNIVIYPNTVIDYLV